MSASSVCREKVEDYLKQRQKNEYYSWKKGHWLLLIIPVSWQKSLTRINLFLSGPWKENRGVVGEEAHVRAAPCAWGVCCTLESSCDWELSRF